MEVSVDWVAVVVVWYNRQQDGRWADAGVGRVVGKQGSMVGTYDCYSNDCSVGPDECDGLSEEVGLGWWKKEESHQCTAPVGTYPVHVAWRLAMTANEHGPVPIEIAARAGDSKGRAC